MSELYLSFAKEVANKFSIAQNKIEATIEMLNNGASVPYLARFKKSVTGDLQMKQLRYIDEKVLAIQELEARREIILQDINAQDNVPEAIKDAISNAKHIQDLEDIFLPYRSERMTKATRANKLGLGKLADALLTTKDADVVPMAEQYVDAEQDIKNAQQALDGARHILLERFAEDYKLLQIVREYLWQNSYLQAVVSKAKNTKQNSYAEYNNFSELASKVSKDKLLTLFQGRAEGFLKLSVVLENAKDYGVPVLTKFFGISEACLQDSAWLRQVVEDAWRLKLLPKVELETLNRLRDIAGEVFLVRFKASLRNLLLVPPVGNKTILGILPNAKSGVAFAVVSADGELVEYGTTYPFGMQGDWYQSLACFVKLIIKHRISVVSIAGSVGYRDMERLIRELIAMYPDLDVATNIVSDYGISVYAQSKSAQSEFPGLSGMHKSAISIARRSQDFLAELSKLDIASLAALQGDFWKKKYLRKAVQTFEDIVCMVGVDLNTDNQNLLSMLPGLDEDLAEQIVKYRKNHGEFKCLRDLQKLPFIDEQIYQQIAAFVYVKNGSLLDQLKLHPNDYELVEKIAADKSVSLKDLLKNHKLLNSVQVEQYVDAEHSVACIKEIIKVLKYADLDPRGRYNFLKVKHDCINIKDLCLGMDFDGIVSCVASFGVFVDIGVYQDGLLHISSLPEKNKSSLQIGKIVKVQVSTINKNKKRFGLVLSEKSPQAETKPAKVKKFQNKAKVKPRPIQPAGVFNTAMADAFTKLRKGEDR